MAYFGIIVSAVILTLRRIRRVIVVDVTRHPNICRLFETFESETQAQRGGTFYEHFHFREQVSLCFTVEKENTETPRGN